jgi:hypothetical protein
MKKITKRDIVFFVLGLLTMVLIGMLLDYEGSVQAFKDGYNSVPDIESTK